MTVDIVEKLKELGLNSYEAKVYLALLKKYPATGYEVSQIASIPQSRAYDALKSLENDNVVFTTNEKPQKYIPVTPKELTQRFKRKVNSTITFLEKNLPNVRENYNEPAHAILGYDNIISAMKETVHNTHKYLYMEIWSDDFKLIEKEIIAAYDRGVDIKIVGYNNLKTVYGLVYNHEGAREIEHYTKSRMIYMLSDDSEAIFGKIENRAIWTKNEDIVFLLKEFIVHDMYLLDINKCFPEQLKYFYGSGFRKLKEKILERQSPFNIH